MSNTRCGDEHNYQGLDLAHELSGSYRSSATPPTQKRHSSAPQSYPGQAQSSTAQSSTDRRRTAMMGLRAQPDDPTAVGDHLQKLIHQQGWEGELAAQRVFDEWAEIVGAEVAAHCRVVGHADGQVQVQADSTAWATQFRLLAPRVVAKLNERLGQGTVVRIDVRGPQAPSWKSGGRSVKGGRGPRDTYG